MKIDGPHALPKVTILTPTKDRPGFLAQCAKYVSAQTYPKHLLQWVIVNSGELFDPYRGRRARPSPAFQALATECSSLEIPLRGVSLGMLRNAGVKAADGDIIVHFDDDDWHAPDRVERQVLPFLVRPQLDLVATDDYYIGLFHHDPVLACKSVT